jgi:hypothetical protein
MKTLFATFLIAGAAVLVGACAQNGAQGGGRGAPTQENADCPRTGQDVKLQTLYGRWRVRIEGRDEAVADLHPHPEYAGVRGTLARGAGTSPGARSAQLAGDINDEGVLALDESEDGRSISAVWALEVQPGSCGKEFKGTWQYAGDEVKHPVAMTRLSPAP